jgi:hypothetical protein
MKRVEKQITTKEGTVTLYSFDGIRWHLSSKDAARRVNAGWQFQKYREEQKKRGPDGRFKKQEKKETIVSPESRLESLGIVRHGSPILGKAKGKNQKYRRNLRAKKEQDVRVMRKAAIHYHRCTGHRFACACETPYLKRKCSGGPLCLLEMANREEPHENH